jgi:hypothetical protein
MVLSVVDKEYKTWHFVVEMITALICGAGVALLLVWLVETILWNIIG